MCNSITACTWIRTSWEVISIRWNFRCSLAFDLTCSGSCMRNEFRHICHNNEVSVSGWVQDNVEIHQWWVDLHTLSHPSNFVLLIRIKNLQSSFGLSQLRASKTVDFVFLNHAIIPRREQLSHSPHVGKRKETIAFIAN